MEHQKLYGLSELNMNVLQMASVVLTPSWKAENISSSFTRVYAVTSGVGYLKFGSTVLTMTEGNVYVIPAGLTFSYSCEEGFSKIYFHISVRQPRGYDIFQGINRCIEFKDSDDVKLIADNFDCDTAIKITSLKAYLYRLTCDCMTLKEDVEIKKYSDYVTEVLNYIGKNLKASLSVEQIAKELFTSPAKIRKAFKDETGVSIGKYIDDRIMFTSELELISSKASIKDISDRLGFCDQFYFSRCFSQKYGISPLKYRKNNSIK